MKKKNLLFFFILMSFSGFSQTQEIDSLKKELLNPSLKDTIKVKLYLKLGEQYLSNNNDSLKHYSELAIKLSKISNDYRLARAFNNMGAHYINSGQMDSARFYLKQGIEIGKLKKDTLVLIDTYSNYALSLRDNTDFEESVGLSLKAMDLIKNNDYLLAESQYNLSVEYGHAGYDSLSMKYLKLSLKNAEKSNHNLAISYCSTNLAFFAIQNKEYDVAKQHIVRMSKLCSETNIPETCLHYYLRAGHYYDNIKNFRKAETSYQQALVQAIELKDTYDIMYSYVALGEHFVFSNEPKKAILNFKKFQKINNKNPTPSIEVWAYEHWATAEKMIKNFKNSNIYLEKFIKINDSINSENNKASIANAETKYQTEKKDKIILEQKLVVSDQQLSIQKSKSKTRLMTILIISLLLASILLWFVFQQRQKRIQQQLVTIQKEQEVMTLESLIAGEEKERLRISQELHDGVNGDLSAIKFKLTSLLKMNNDVINEAVSMIDNSCKQVRAISHNLVPPSLKDFSLVEAVNNYCENMNSIHKLEIGFQDIGAPINLNKKVEVNMFRIIQELVTNATKHAEASAIDVQISHRNHMILITVEDDGKGYENKDKDISGIGLENIKSRVEYLNASLDVVTNNTGTYNTIEIDLNKLNDN